MTGETVYDSVMGQNFLPDTVNQRLLFPPSLHDWLPDGHLARFVVDGHYWQSDYERIRFVFGPFQMTFPE